MQKHLIECKAKAESKTNTSKLYLMHVHQSADRQLYWFTYL